MQIPPLNRQPFHNAYLSTIDSLQVDIDSNRFSDAFLLLLGLEAKYEYNEQYFLIDSDTFSLHFKDKLDQSLNRIFAGLSIGIVTLVNQYKQQYSVLTDPEPDIESNSDANRFSYST